MKTNTKSGSYTATPASVILPLAPTPATLKPPQGKDAPLPVIGAESQVTSIDEAQAHTQELVQECKRRLRNRDMVGVLHLVNERPELIANPWICETYYKLVRAGRYRQPRGRPRGTFNHHPLVVVGLVDEAIRSGEVRTPEKAFRLLEDVGWSPYNTIKQLYYRAKHEARFQPLFVAETDKTRPAMAEDMARLAGAEVMTPGRVVKQRFHHPKLGSGEFRLSVQKKDG